MGQHICCWSVLLLTCLGLCDMLLVAVFLTFWLFHFYYPFRQLNHWRYSKTTAVFFFKTNAWFSLIAMTIYLHLQTGNILVGDKIWHSMCECNVINMLFTVHINDNNNVYLFNVVFMTTAVMLSEFTLCIWCLYNAFTENDVWLCPFRQLNHWRYSKTTAVFFQN